VIDHLNLALFSNWHVIVIQPFAFYVCVVFEIGVVDVDEVIGNTRSRRCILYALEVVDIRREQYCRDDVVDDD
jgi:hypothetical protein